MRLQRALLCGLFVWLMAAAAGAAADEVTPRAYLPLVGRAREPVWVWHAALTPGLTPTPSQIVLALDHRDQVHVLWDVTVYQAPRFIYHSYTDSTGAGEWSTPTPVANNLGESTLIDAPAVGFDDSLFLLWNSLVEPGRQYRLLVAAFRNGVWSAPEVAYQTGGSVDGVVRADRAGQLAVTGVEGILGQVFQVVRLGDGRWSAPQFVPRSQSFATMVTLPDWAGGVHLYETPISTPAVLYYSHWRNGVFVERNVPVSARVGSRNTSLDVLGNLHVDWSEMTAIPGRNITALHHQCLEGGVQPWAVEIPSGERVRTDHVSAIGITGRFGLAWRDDSGAVWLGEWQGCTRRSVRQVPLPDGSDWRPRSLALGATSDAACLLLAKTLYATQYTVVCGRMR